MWVVCRRTNGRRFRTEVESTVRLTRVRVRNGLGDGCSGSEPSLREEPLRGVENRVGVREDGVVSGEENRVSCHGPCVIKRPLPRTVIHQGITASIGVRVDSSPRGSKSPPATVTLPPPKVPTHSRSESFSKDRGRDSDPETPLPPLPYISDR